MSDHETFPPPEQRPTTTTHGEPCPKCRRPLDNDGWCIDCSRRRKVLTTIALIVVGPILGFGSCLAGIGSTSLNLLIPIGLALMILSPIAGIIYAIVAAIRANNRQ